MILNLARVAAEILEYGRDGRRYCPDHMKLAGRAVSAVCSRRYTVQSLVLLELR